jgi:TonB family protein
MLLIHVHETKEGEDLSSSPSLTCRGNCSNYYDFIVRFDAQVVNDGTVGGVLVHALLVPETEKRACYEVRLSDSEGRTGTLLWHRQNQTLLALPNGPTLKGSSGWRTYELENRGTTLTFTVDGQRLFVGTDLLHNMGRLGFSVTKGVIELRNIRLYRVPLPDQPPLAGSVRPEGGVSPPVLLQMVKPTYTGQALSAQAQGEVWIDCVVLPDGTVGDVRVARSFRPDLDAQAMAAAKQWRFKPATRNGQPVAALVSLSMTFTLK